MLEISEERLVELSNNLWSSDLKGYERGYMSLELGQKEGLVTGYPELFIIQFKDEYILSVTIPSGSPGYDKRRDITLEEMVTFVLVAKRKAPNERMTAELVKKVKEILTGQKELLERALELIK